MPVRSAAVLLGLVALSAPARAEVVINEILYNAPDELDDLQFVELHNAGAAAADLGGWKLGRGARYEFPPGTTIPPDGFLVLCRDPKLFRKHYGSDAAGRFEGRLDDEGTVELLDSAGRRVDRVKYRNRPPWPAAPDGYGPSLERVCPAAGTGPENWAPSPLPAGPPRPGGTPGKRNANHAPHPPPVISKVRATPTHPAPGQGLKVEADVRSGRGLRGVTLHYRVAGPGYEKQEVPVAMTRGAGDRFTAAVAGQKAGQIVRFRIKAADADGGERWFPSANELRPALSAYVHDPFRVGKVPFGLILNVGEARGGAPSPRGKSAFVYVRPETGEPELFDFINVTPRSAGRRVRFHKDRPLDDMTTISLIYEPVPRALVAEPLAFELYRRAGNAAPRTDFVRTWVDGRPIGPQLLVEQPNKAFLRHNKLRADGNLYKIVWFGNGLVGQHEKKTNLRGGHDDLVRLVDALNRTRGREQWAVIEKHFDVPQVATYFVVNTLLSHWDGFFNNYFTYHDVHGTGKWTMYPWDQDKTWGYHDGIAGDQVFFDMPLTFGMSGDRPPGGAAFAWWRPPGHFSGPLLANSQFRKVFLARTRELLDKVYTEEAFFPVIKETGERLQEEVRVRAELHREDPKRAVQVLHRDVDALREHLTKRRRFLLDQPELKAVRTEPRP